MTDDPGPAWGAYRPGWIRNGSVFVRAAHLLAASAVCGSVLLGAGSPKLHAWWIGTAASGLVLLGVEFLWHRSLYREVAGWSTIVKLLLIGCIPAVPGGGPVLMSCAFVVAVVGAHAPRHWRHRRLF